MITKEQRLQQIKFVVDNSNHVSINKEKIKEYLSSIKIKDNPHWLNQNKLKLDEKQLILLTFLVESMNFCFWKEPFIEKDFDNQKYKKSTAMFYSVVDEVIKNKNFLNLSKLKNLTKKELIKIFGGNNNSPYIDNRYNNLLETINIIISNEDEFYKNIFSCKSDQELLDYIVSNFPSFNDISTYKNQQVYFYKRATLLVRDLYEVSQTVKKNIKNINNLLGCADYGIPRTFRYYGILKYSSELSYLVDNRKLIPHDSEYEVEIRANMLYALEIIKEELNKNNIKTNSVLLDNLIWLTGRNINENHHLTETIFY